MEVKDNFELTMQQVVAIALGYDLKDPKTPALVRIGWQTEGQPGPAITDNIAYVRGTPEDDPNVDRQVDVKYTANDDGTTTRTTTYMQVWRCHFTFYGPSCTTNAFAVRRALIAAELHSMLSIALTQSGIFLVPDVAPPSRVPEQFSGEWWERADMEAKFNILITETASDLAAASVKVIIEKENGLTDTVTAQKLIQ
jgi:hypothetical protein